MAFEQTQSGQISNYLWFAGQLVGLVRDGKVYSIATDHVGRPEVVWDSNNAVVWRAANRAFDRTVAQDSIGGVNIGFPGQYYDTETGFWYNGHRDYDAATGRYFQPDPLGLDGGINPYLYASGNPLMNVDPLGLFDWPSLPQGVVDFSAGMGDTISLGTTIGIRELMGTNGAVNFSSKEYAVGVLAGMNVNRWAMAEGAEFRVSQNLRFAPWGNRTGDPIGRFPHYHRRGVDAKGETRPGQGIGRHRPWEKKSTDKCLGDRF